MARYKHVELSPRFTALILRLQLLPEKTEHALHQLIDRHEPSVSSYPFYRSVRGQPASREDAFKFAGTLSATAHVSDAKAFVAWLDAQKAVDRRRKIGTTRYCMGGPIVMRTAGSLPERIGAGCTFHGGGLTTTNPDSPHLLIPNMKASMLIAIADNDDQKDPTSKDILRKTFDDAKVSAEIEVYKGANHGWMPPDSQNHNAEAAERGWTLKLELFKKALA